MSILGFLGGLNPISLGLTGIGALGSLFGGDPEMTDEQRRAFGALESRTRGIDPKTLRLMRARMRGSVGQEFAGASANRMAQLRRQNAPNVIQRQEFEKLSTRRAGATSDALLGVDRLNEQVKGQATGQLANFTSRFPQTPGSGQGFSGLFGAGLQGLLQGGQNPFLDEELLRMKNKRFPDFNQSTTAPLNRIRPLGGGING